MRCQEGLTILALAWIIIGPPWNVDSPAEGAPLGQWERVKQVRVRMSAHERVRSLKIPAFKTEADCERFLAKGIKHAFKEEWMIWFRGADGVRCISSEEFSQAKAAAAKESN